MDQTGIPKSRLGSQLRSPKFNHAEKYHVEDSAVIDSSSDDELSTIMTSNIHRRTSSRASNNGQLSPMPSGGLKSPAAVPQDALENPESSESPLEQTAVHRLDATGSVQAIAVDDDVLFAGLQGGEIVAWSLETYEQLARVHAHQQSVLALSLSEDKSLLFSSGVDSVINVWSASTLKRLYTLHSHFEVGDIFCVAYSAQRNTVFCGAQNSSIQWYELETQPPPASVLPTTAATRKHRFFDSLGPGGVPSVIPQANDIDGTSRPNTGRISMIPQSNYLQYAHKSYIYSILLAKGLLEHNNDQEILITAGGGGTIKLWSIDQIQRELPVLLEKFKNRGNSVYSLAYKAPFLYAGLADGVAHIYNLASRQLVRKLQMGVGCGDILQIQVSNGSALCGTSQGWVKRTSNRFTEVNQWTAHKGKILATAVSDTHGRNLLVTGGNDNTIAFWDISERGSRVARSATRSNDELVNSLRQFVAYRTVAANLQCVSECHQAAEFLRKLFNAFGASTSFISPQEGVNPILLAKFAASKQPQNKKTILFYGHYDVVDADINISNTNPKWHADPFTLHPMNGYFYGRGVTDNKGPILAALFAVEDLLLQDELSCNVIFLLEGDEEAGSRGFRPAVQKHKQEIGHVDYVMLSNSYWLDDHIPCLTFGMRGVVHASITITSSRPDLHSGMDGKSTQHEPLKDLTVLLGLLIGADGTEIKVPDFYKAVDELHPNELKAYSKITAALTVGHPEIKGNQSFTQSLIQKWREPSLTIHSIQVPESKTAVTISRSAKATLSIRIVPRQSADEIANQLESFLQAQFNRIKSTNVIEVKITSKADPWLGKVNNKIYSTLKEAITEVWKGDNLTVRSFPQAEVDSASKRPQQRRGSSLITAGTFTPLNTPHEPLFIREGGSIPAISFLEREFNAPAAMFPMGQASDNAHLDNERIRVDNLYKGREILRKVFSRL